MRNIRTQIRKYVTPIEYRKISSNSYDEMGVRTIKYEPTIIIFASVVDNALLNTQGNNEGEAFDLSIKIRRTSIKIAVEDRINYLGNQFIIKSIMRDRYSLDEYILKCVYECEAELEQPESNLDGSIEFRMC